MNEEFDPQAKTEPKITRRSFMRLAGGAALVGTALATGVSDTAQVRHGETVAQKGKEPEQDQGLAKRAKGILDTVASLGSSTAHAQALSRRTFIAAAPRYANINSDRLATPVKESLETQLERIIRTFRRADVAPAEALIKTVPNKLEMKIDPNAPYSVIMDPTLKEQVVRFIEEDANMPPEKGGGFDDAMILWFANPNDIPREISKGYHVRRIKDSSGEVIRTIEVGSFGVKKDVVVGGRRLRLVTYAPKLADLSKTPPESGTTFDDETIVYIRSFIGTYLNYITVTGHDAWDSFLQTQEQTFRMDARDPVFKKLSIITTRS